MSAEAVDWSRSERLNPWVATGDFDGNGVRDWAVLGIHNGQRKVALCINPGRQQKLLMIDDPYCSDVIFRTKAKSVLFDIQAEHDRTIRHDGITVLCIGKAGATYILESGKLVQIVDSD